MYETFNILAFFSQWGGGGVGRSRGGWVLCVFEKLMQYTFIYSRI